jgi:hypothetical protein
MSCSDDAIPQSQLATTYQPTPEERASLAAHFARRKQNPPVPRIKLAQKGGAFEVSTDYPIPSLGNALIMEVFATADADFFDGLLSQLVSVGKQANTPDERGPNFLLAMISTFSTARCSPRPWRSV